MSYHVVLTRSAKKELLRLPDAIYDAVAEKLLALQETPRPDGCKKLKGHAGYRVRVGDYRMLYEIRDAEFVVTIYAIRHRREAYR